VSVTLRRGVGAPIRLSGPSSRHITSPLTVETHLRKRWSAWRCAADYSHGGSQGFKSPHLHPQTRRSERRQRRAGGAHCILRPPHGRTRKSQPRPGGSQRPGPEPHTMTTQRSRRFAAHPGSPPTGDPRAHPAHPGSPRGRPSHYLDQLPPRRRSPGRRLRWPSTAYASLDRQVPTRAADELAVDRAGDHADAGHPSHAAVCPTAPSTTSRSDTVDAGTHGHWTPTPDTGHLDAQTPAPDTGQRPLGQARVMLGHPHQTLDSGRWPRTPTR
jgi:hypothetical protein